MAKPFWNKAKLFLEHGQAFMEQLFWSKSKFFCSKAKLFWNNTQMTLFWSKAKFFRSRSQVLQEQKPSFSGAEAKLFKSRSQAFQEHLGPRPGLRDAKGYTKGR